MSHKSGGVIINAMMPEGGQPIACLTPQECADLAEIRQRDEYTLGDRMRLAMIVAVHADDPID